MTTLERIVSRKPQRRRQNLQLTTEQRAIVECTAPCVLVRAYSGTGKTTVLREYALQRPNVLFTYICFNKAIQLASARTFPPNVTCVTFDALAYRRYVYGYKVTVDTGGGMRPLNASFVRAMMRGSTFRTRDGSRLQVPYAMCRQIASTLENFARGAAKSKDARIHRRHVPAEKEVAHVPHIKQLAQWVWRKYLRRESPHLCHTLNRLVLWAEGLERDVHAEHTLLIDEAQDLNAPMAAAVMSAPHRSVVVGDRYQQIYGTFMGSVNVLDSLHRRGTHLFQLTYSFRFGIHVAALLSRLLNLIDAHPRVRQHDTVSRVKLRGNEKRHTRLLEPHETMETPFVALFRSNLKLFSRAYTYAKQDLRIHILGWRSFRLQMLAAKESTNTDEESLGVARIIERYDPEVLHDAIRAIDVHHVDDESKADIVLSTIHKFKGREAPRVWVHNDIKLKTQFQFQAIGNSRRVGVVWSEEERENINLAYVAMSRAIEELRVDVDVKQYVYEAENVSCALDSNRDANGWGGVVVPEDTSASAAIRVVRTGEQPRTLYLLKNTTHSAGTP